MVDTGFLAASHLSNPLARKDNSELKISFLFIQRSLILVDSKLNQGQPPAYEGTGAQASVSGVVDHS